MTRIGASTHRSSPPPTSRNVPSSSWAEAAGRDAGRTELFVFETELQRIEAICSNAPHAVVLPFSWHGAYCAGIDRATTVIFDADRVEACAAACSCKPRTDCRGSPVCTSTSCGRRAKSQPDRSRAKITTRR